MSTAATLPDKIKEIRATLQGKLKTLPDFGFGIRDKIPLLKGASTTSTQTQNGVLNGIGQGPIRKMIQDRQAGQGGLIKGLGQGKFLQSFQGKRFLQTPTAGQKSMSGHITDAKKPSGPAVESESYPSSNEIAVEL